MPKNLRSVFLFKYFAAYPDDVELRGASRKQSHHGLKSRWRPSQLCPKRWANAANNKRLFRSHLVPAMQCQCAHSSNAALLEI